MEDRKKSACPLSFDKNLSLTRWEDNFIPNPTEEQKTFQVHIFSSDHLMDLPGECRDPASRARGRCRVGMGPDRTPPSSWLKRCWAIASLQSRLRFIYRQSPNLLSAMEIHQRSRHIYAKFRTRLEMIASSEPRPRGDFGEKTM
jgi:hypothetical protein